jgi:hypothetical protein
MIRNFYNADIDVTVIIDYTGPMKLEGWKRVA